MKYSRICWPFSVLLVIVWTLTGCTEAGPVSEAQLLGRWTIKEAISNGRPTERMASLFYEFKPEGELVTNMTGSAQTIQYALRGDIIEQRGGAMEADYQIEAFQDSILVLTTDINGFSFRFTLRRADQQ